MSIVKNQHYVPQAYLRNFKVNNKNQIYVFDKEKEVSRKQNINDIACERFFYDISPEIYKNNPEYDKQAIEKFFATEIEDEFSNVIRNVIISHDMAPKSNLFHNNNLIPDKDLKKLSILLAFQMVRTKSFRENFIQMYEDISTSLARKILETEGMQISDFKIKANEQYIPYLHASKILDEKFINEISVILYNHIWIIGVNYTKSPFITSDNPIVKKGHLENILGGVGIKSEGVEIAFPLNSTLILIMFDRRYFKKYEHQDRCFMELDEDNVVYYNSLQAIQSYRQIYSCKDSFKVVEETISKNPEIKNIKRKRIKNINEINENV